MQPAGSWQGARQEQIVLVIVNVCITKIIQRQAYTSAAFRRYFVVFSHNTGCRVFRHRTSSHTTSRPTRISHANNILLRLRKSYPRLAPHTPVYMYDGGLLQWMRATQLCSFHLPLLTGATDGEHRILTCSARSCTERFCWCLKTCNTQNTIELYSYSYGASKYVKLQRNS